MRLFDKTLINACANCKHITNLGLQERFWCDVLFSLLSRSVQLSTVEWLHGIKTVIEMSRLELCTGRNFMARPDVVSVRPGPAR